MGQLGRNLHKAPVITSLLMTLSAEPPGHIFVTWPPMETPCPVLTWRTSAVSPAGPSAPGSAAAPVTACTLLLWTPDRGGAGKPSQLRGGRGS